MARPIKGVTTTLTRLTERVTYKDGVIYFDGDELDNALAAHIIKIIESGAEAKDYQSFALFLENLAQNPSKKSRKHLYSFIETHGMTISDDGHLIAYKGVQKDGTSIHAGYGIVDGVEYENAYLPNAVGSVVEIPRSQVDDDRNAACSTGLHAGTFRYAQDFAQGLLLTVKVNPRDVVSVPADHSNAKIRTARYSVLEVNEGAKIDTLTYDTSAHADNDWEPDPEPEPEAEDDGTVSDDVLADALSEALDKADTQGGDVTVTITYRAGRDANGRFVKGDANPGKTQPRDERGHFLPTH